jgi:hypothetical protein
MVSRKAVVSIARLFAVIAILVGNSMIGALRADTECANGKNCYWTPSQGVYCQSNPLNPGYGKYTACEPHPLMNLACRVTKCGLEEEEDVDAEEMDCGGPCPE